MGLKWSLDLFLPLPNVATVNQPPFPTFHCSFGCLNGLLEGRWLNLTSWGGDCDPELGDTPCSLRFPRGEFSPSPRAAVVGASSGGISRGGLCEFTFALLFPSSVLYSAPWVAISVLPLIPTPNQERNQMKKEKLPCVK